MLHNYITCPIILLSFVVSWQQHWYDEPGRVGSHAVQVVVVWVLSIVVSSRLIEVTLFYEITVYVGQATETF